MKILQNILFVFLLPVFLFISCKDTGGKMEERSKQQNAISKISKEKWEKLSSMKIYFGHMSVGYNIIDGINDLIRDNHLINLNIVETTNSDDFNQSIFAHSKNGKNNDPESKIDAFVEKMKNGIGKNVDFALLKLCYVDIHANTDIDTIFNDYTNAMNHLNKMYPDTKFIHFTVPLTTYKKRDIKEKIKDNIKKIIGRTTQKEIHIINNIKRNKFNEMIKNYYKNDVFDIAEAESTYTDMRREIFDKDGNDYFALVPIYTDDGGHLNELGRKLIAEQLLVFLIEHIN